jgi:nitrogen regulatory protein PII-like uncharacterized protein
MKKYFTKYLPVEGKIDENEIKDTWLITPKGLATFELRVHKDINTLTNKIRVHNGKTYVDFLDTEVKLAKLFLCSRDIQVGDKYFEHTQVKPDRYEEFVAQEDDSIENSFKIIGEISPDAIWVTEGMEFDEDEVKESYIITNDKRSSSYNLHWYRIKCPTCKTYH